MTHTLLLVEDDEDLRDMMRDALEEEGYVVVTARDGQEALDAVPRIESLCLIVLDLVMPVMNGWDFCTAFRARPGNERIPVLVHSSATDRVPAGVTRVVQKPIKLERLIALVREYCSDPVGPLRA
jgi:CheY-like chemotaxis protein